MLREVFKTIDLMVMALNQLTNKGEGIKSSYEANHLGDNKNYYGNAYRVGRKLVIVAECD